MIKAPFKGVLSDLTFNARNQLVSALGYSYQYDAEGYRIQQAHDGITTRYTVNPEAELSQVLIAHQGDSKTYYVYGLGLIGQEKNGDYKSYHYDYRGSTIALSNKDSALTDRFSYSPFGDLSSHIGKTQTPFKYNGRDGVVSDDNGLDYMRARYYSPELHRFVNQDVLLGEVANSASLNRFGYVGGNPLSRIDPTGNFYDITTDPVLTAIGISETYRLYNEGSYGWAFAGAVGTAIDICTTALPIIPTVGVGAGIGGGERFLSILSKETKTISNANVKSGVGFIVTPDGVTIPKNVNVLTENLKYLDFQPTSTTTSLKYVGYDELGPIRIRIEKAHSEDKNFIGPIDPLHTVDHLHIDRRQNITTGPFKSKEKIEYEFPFK